MRGMRARWWLLVLAVTPVAACHAPDPQAVLEVTDVEAYWAVDPPSAETRYIAPAARLHVRNKGPVDLRSVQATATFRRKGEAQTWGSDWQQISTTIKPLAPGQTALVLLKSDARYSSPVEPEAMFTHQMFKDARVEIFLRVGSSAWSKFADADVARRIGSREIEQSAALAPSPSPPPSPSPSPSPRRR